jgi:hypothetical protein
MKTAMRERFVAHPALYGARLGALVLTLFQVATDVGFFILSGGSISALYSEPLLILILLKVVSPPLFWGWLLGRSVGQAWHHWIHDYNEPARRTLRRTGGWCTLINGAWILAQDFGTSIPEFWKSVILELLTNFCFQASVLVLTLSFLLPPRKAERLQVTENLRL